MPNRDLILRGEALSVQDVVDVARGNRGVRLDDEGRKRMEESRAVVEGAVGDGRTVYGVTTGFGALANVRIPSDELEAMQSALLRSHAAGVGPPLDDEIVRAMLVLRARTLASGRSGVRPVLVERLIDFLNAGLHPVVPRQGSVGASGDLAQLAHLSLPLIGEGRARIGGKVLPGAEALRAANLEPVSLSFKEGLSLLNGTEAMTAVLALAVWDAEILVRTADVVCAMSVEALLGTDKAFDERIHFARPHPGQRTSAGNLRRLLAGSPIVASHRESEHAVQDAYSVRCAPQVHGAVRDVLAFARRTVETEMASVTDNPMVFAEDGEVLSGGNFHGEPLGFALDFIAAATSELGSISERRTDRLLDPDHSSGLPPFLTEHAGTNSGFMLVQYTQAALVAENRINSSPATVDTIPTSGTQEDHVSMGWNAALKVRTVIGNVATILAIEAICAAQGIEFRRPLEPAPATKAALEVVRELVDHLDADRPLGEEIERVTGELVLNGRLVERVAAAAGDIA